MAKEEILGGLRVAVDRGSSLQEAMQGFYNAGYKKEDIEEAARELQNIISRQSNPLQPQPQAPQSVPQKIPPFNQPTSLAPSSNIKPLPTSLKPTEPLPTPVTIPKENSFPLKPEDFTPKIQPSNKQDSFLAKQNVSSYPTEKTKKKFDGVTVTLIIVLVLLLGLLGSVFVFKSSVVNLLNKIL